MIPEQVDGWRSWQYVVEGGGLVYSDGKAAEVWPVGKLSSVCVPNSRNGWRSATHTAPAAGCFCGARLVQRVRHLTGYIRALKCGNILGESDLARNARRLGCYEDRRYWEVLDVPDAIGRAVGSGRLIESDRSCQDPPGTWRCQYLEVGDRLYLSPHLWREAENSARRYQVEVVMLTTLGHPWLDEIVAYEAAQPDVAAAGTVTHLALPGIVLPTWLQRRMAEEAAG